MIQNQQTVVISGGSRGLGASLVASFLDKGYNVATFSRSCSEFIQQYQALYTEQGRFLWQAIDGTDFDKFKPFVRQVVEQFGSIDVLINNAGVGDDGILTLMRTSDIHRIIALNYEAAVFLSQTCAKVMLQQESGNIINISSVHGIRGHAGVSVYSSTKSALDGFTRSLARELGPRNIRVNSIAPGFFESDMAQTFSTEKKQKISRRTPLQRLGTVDDITRAVSFLVSSDASFITGQTLAVDGGITC